AAEINSPSGNVSRRTAHRSARRQTAVWWCRDGAAPTVKPGKVLTRGRDLPAPTAEHTAAYGQPELACDTPRLPPERRRATGSTSGLDRALNHPSGRDPTVPRTAGRTNNGRSPDGSGGGRDSSASCRGCTSSFL